MSAEDALNELGLDNVLGTAGETVAPAVDTAAALADAAGAVEASEGVAVTRTPVAIKSVTVGLGGLPASRKPVKGEGSIRAPRESKYKFAELVAPAAQEDGSFAYSYFTVEAEEGVTIKALRSAVQSAANAQNKKGKETGVKYVTRVNYNDADEAVAVSVYRVDNTLATEEVAA